MLGISPGNTGDEGGSGLGVVDEQAVACAKKAVELDAGNYDKHHTFAALLTQCGHYAEAVEQYRWCLERRPNDKTIIQGLSNANRKQLMR